MTNHHAAQLHAQAYGFPSVQACECDECEHGPSLGEHGRSASSISHHQHDVEMSCGFSGYGFVTSQPIETGTVHVEWRNMSACELFNAVDNISISACATSFPVPDARATAYRSNIQHTGEVTTRMPFSFAPFSEIHHMLLCYPISHKMRYKCQEQYRIIFDNADLAMLIR